MSLPRFSFIPQQQPNTPKAVEVDEKLIVELLKKLAGFHKKGITKASPPSSQFTSLEDMKHDYDILAKIFSHLYLFAILVRSYFRANKTMPLEDRLVSTSIDLVLHTITEDVDKLVNPTVLYVSIPDLNFRPNDSTPPLSQEE